MKYTCNCMLLVVIVSLGVGCHKDELVTPDEGQLSIDGVIGYWPFHEPMIAQLWSQPNSYVESQLLSTAQIGRDGWFHINFPVPQGECLTTRSDILVGGNQQAGVVHGFQFRLLVTSAATGGLYGALYLQSPHFWDSTQVGEFVCNLVYVDRAVTFRDTIMNPYGPSRPPHLLFAIGPTAISSGWAITDTTYTQRSLTYTPGWNIVEHRVIERQGRRSTIAMTVNKPTLALIWHYGGLDLPPPWGKLYP